MAEDMEIVEKLNGDNLQVNGDENGERSNAVNSSKDTDSGVLTDGYKMENQEPLDTSDSSIQFGLEDSPGKDKRADESRGASTVIERKETDKDAVAAIKEGSKSPRGIKRKASSTLSDADDTEEESLKGFETPVDDGSADRYSRLVDKYQSELRETEAEITSNRPSRAKKPPVKRARTGTPTDNYSSRPSSGLSLRSENELVGGNSSSTEVTSSAASSPAARRAARAETSHAAYRVPLDRGWKRELVYRATLEHGAGARRNADVYYYTPSAKKLRSNREVAEHIAGSNLTLDNFTFFKEPLGVDDPEKEIIRDAKIVRRVESPSPHVSTPTVAATTPGREGKRTPKPKPPKGASPERAASTASPKTGGGKLKVKSVGSRLSLSTGLPSVATPPKPVKTPRKSLLATPTNNNTTTGWKKPRAAESARRAAVPPPPPLLYGPAQQGAAAVGKMLSPPRGGGQQPCSVRCAGAEGRVPSLQCASCLCLYHERCCAPSGVPRQAFVCKNCQPQQGPPPLTHMSAMKPTQSKFLGIAGNHQSPAMQRIPKPVPTLVRPPDPKRPIPVPRLMPIRRVLANPTPKLVKKPIQSPNTQIAMQEQKRVVMKMKMQSASSGSGQAIWTVQNSDAQASSQLGISTNNMQMITIDPMKLPQTIAFVNGRKFIVVPKNSFVNAVASGVAAAATTGTSKNEEGQNVIGDTKEKDEIKTKENEDVKKSVLDCVGGASETLRDGDTETSASMVKTEESTDRDTESSMDISQTE